MNDTPPPSAPAPSPAPATPPPPAAAPKSGNRTLIIILCVLGGLFLLFGGCVATCTYFAAKKAREYSAQAEKNPAYASLSLIASLHPGVEVVARDETTGKITLRNKQTGKVTTIDTTEYTADNVAKALEKFAASAQAAADKATAAATEMQNAAAAAAAQAQVQAEPANDAADTRAALAQLPAYLAPYPGATIESASYDSPAGIKLANSVVHTADKPKAVVAYYEQKLTAAGYAITSKNVSGVEATLSALAGSPTRNVTIIISGGDDGQSQVDLSFQQLGQ